MWKKKQNQILADWKQGKPNATNKDGTVEFTIKIGADILNASNVKIGENGELYEDRVTQNLSKKLKIDTRPPKIASPVLKEDLENDFNHIYNDDSGGLEFKTSGSGGSNNNFLGHVNDSREQTPTKLVNSTPLNKNYSLNSRGKDDMGLPPLNTGAKQLNRHNVVLSPFNPKNTG